MLGLDGIKSERLVFCFFKTVSEELRRYNKYLPSTQVLQRIIFYRTYPVSADLILPLYHWLEDDWQPPSLPTENYEGVVYYQPLDDVHAYLYAGVASTFGVVCREGFGVLSEAILLYTIYNNWVII